MAPNRPPPPPLSSYRPTDDRAVPPGARRPPQRTGPPPGQRTGARPPKRSGGAGIFTAFYYLFLLTVLVLGTGVAYLVFNPPSDLIRRQITEQVKAKTGRDLTVAGPATITFYPSLGVALKDVALSGPPGMPTSLVTMDALNVSVKALPLFKREIEVTTLTLDRPVFNLRIARDGKRNWDFAALTPRDWPRYAQAGAASDLAAPRSVATGRTLPERLARLKRLELSDVRLIDGTMKLTDERTGKVQQVSGVNVNLALPSLDEPVTADGSIMWAKDKIAFDGQLGTIRTILEEKPARLTFKAGARTFNASYDGRVLIKDGADLDGQVKATAQSARALAGWLGTTLPPVAGFGPLSLEGAVKTNGNVTTFSNTTFGLDGATAVGTLAVKTGGVRPAVSANLKISELDLNKYMVRDGTQPIDTTAPAGASAPRKAAPAAPPAGKDGGDAIEKLLNAPATKVYGATQRAGWSSDTLNLALLGAADVNAKLQLGRLRYDTITIGQTALTVALKDRILKSTFDDMRLYEGRGSGALNVDGTGKAAGVGANFALQGVSALPFLTDAADMKWLAGKADIGLQVNAAGASQLALVESMAGKADFKFADGAIVGFNVPGALRGLQKGDLSGLKAAPSEKTDFSALTASFAIQNGIAQNQDLQLTSPLLRVTGAGTVSLPGRSVDYTAKPKLVASLKGQEGNTALSGIEIPVRITGPWSRLKYEPDFQAVLSDPKTAETVKNITEHFKGKNSKEIADELLGPDSKETKKKAKDFLKKFLAQ